jgi:hypothetical protein
MCEHCSGSRTWNIELVGAFQCGMVTCGMQATALAFSEYVGEHLCQKHIYLLNNQFGEIGYAIHHLGQISFDFLPIEHEVS